MALNKKKTYSGISLESLTFLSVDLESRNNKSKEFLRVVAESDTTKVKEYLQNHKDEIDINYKDSYGNTALRIAIKMQKSDLLQVLLLFDDIHLSDALLYAAEIGSIFIIDMLLKCQTRQPSPIDIDSSDSIEYMPGTTPLIVASINNNYKMAKFLLLKGYKVEKPHLHSCNCIHCETDHSKDRLINFQTKLLAYQALSSPVLLSLSSQFFLLETKDPIYNAFSLHKELSHLMDCNDQYKSEYEKCAASCSAFAVDLLNCCRTIEEIETLLKQKYGSKDPRSHNYHRLFLAVQYNQKEFVAHRNCQDVIHSFWIGNSFQWKRNNLFLKILYLFYLLISFPWILCIRTLSPSEKFISLCRIPVNRFIYHIYSDIVFLSILFADLWDNTKVRGNLFLWKKWILLLWIIGLFWQHLGFIQHKGLKSFLKYKWRKYDCIMILLFFVSYAGWIASYIQIQLINPALKEYPRESWFTWDPSLISEGFFSIASILAFMRILYLLQINSKLGPLSLSLSEMLTDIIKFMFIFFLIIFAYSIGLNTIYKHYINQINYISATEFEQQPQSFTRLLKTYSTLFWSLFGYGEQDNPAIVLSNITESIVHVTVKNATSNHHWFTEGVGYFIYGSYHITAVIILLNMLIAMMANTFEAIKNNTDVEWKFARSVVKLDFFEEYTTMPSPFNLIPNFISIIRCFLWLFKKCFKKHIENIECSLKLCCYPNIDFSLENEERNEDRYKILIRRLLQRYDTFEKKRKTQEFNKQEIVEIIKNQINQRIDQLNVINL